MVKTSKHTVNVRAVCLHLMTPKLYKHPAKDNLVTKYLLEGE